MHFELTVLIAIAAFQAGYLIGWKASRNASEIEARTRALTVELIRLSRESK